ncbi:filamentous haemagglutinin family protein [Sideroxydans sp. CL21]|uniref:filamentous haemagglutinin family protein n=1 Tax=Sideroxydans sp. CL21 TaxID=2600596 RepID=UPI0012A920C2|nr:filamentous haemagglutinin family protein [Sideroxydans sp. CL21]VVC83085.1 hypothetical protein [Sideroxydans sp. CL21]
MKNDKQKVGTKQTRVPQIGRLTLLVGALIATGVLSPLSLPEAVAAPLPVPMGLPCGGCTLAANAPTNVYSNFAGAGTSVTMSNIDPKTGLPNANNLTINQQSQVAILNWQQFNIAQGNTVTFVQPSSTSSALNRIWDANPTTIAGSLTANGQLYLINQNGIVFANGAQVNTNALIASSLNITDSVYQNGYLANNNTPGTGVITPTFSGNSGFVRVDTGAVLNGSRIMLFAPVVENNGSIVTADGQAVLAAGYKVYLEASQDPNLRGVLVEVDFNNPGSRAGGVAAPNVGVADPNLAGKGLQHTEVGTVTNTADIVAQRGNITLIGYAVNQQGRVSATTSVTENGSIKLLARYNLATSIPYNQSQTTDVKDPIYDIRANQTGVVTLAKGSLTQITPETTDTSTTTDGQGFNPSIVEVMGKNVNVEGSIFAPGGKVNLVAAGYIDPTVGSLGYSGNGIYQEIDPKLAYSSFLNPNYKPVATADGARVFLDNGSLIDVSGSTASVSVARDIIAVQLRGTELANAPLQKNGMLYGQTVYVDIRKGTTLANYSGEEAQIGRTVAERTSAGGNVVIASTGDAVMNPGAVINISGGQVNHTGANINTTSLISNGKVYDIATASPNMIYAGISGTYSVTHSKWGITETFSTMAGGDLRGRWDPGYVEGKAAGSVTLLVPNAAVEGEIIANTVSGIYQRQPYVDMTASGTLTPLYMNTWQMLPKGGTLTIGYNGSGALNATTGQYNFLTNHDVAVQANSQQTTNYAPLDALSPTSPIVLDTSLFSSNLNNLNVYTNGIARIDAGTPLVLASGGSVTLQGGQADMLGSINVSGGSVSLGTVSTVNPKYNLAGAVTVGGNISTRGTWVNDSKFFGPFDPSKAIVTNGGNISINSGNDLIVASGLTLDASAGGWVDQSGTVHGGNGGNISLSGNSVKATDGTALSGLDSIALKSYGLDSGTGGSFKLALIDDIQIGGVAANGAFLLPAEFFQSGGFSAYTINSGGIYGLNVDGFIQPKAQSLILNRDAAFKATGTDVYALSNPGFQPDWQRKPVNITLGQTSSAGFSALTIGDKAEILVDPTASITLNSVNQLNVLGTLDAPAGSINLNLNLPANLYIPTQSIWLGSGSQLLARGYFLQAQPTKKNLTQGQMLAGGKINISGANNGYVVAQKGSLMDVSGASANIDLPQLQSGNLVYRTSHVAGDAGSISVQSSEGALFDGSMNAAVEAGSQAAAGSFSLTLKNNPGIAQLDPLISPLYPTNPAQIQVMSGGNGSFATQVFGSNTKLVAGGIATSTILDPLAGRVLLDANALQKAGFDQVTLKSDNAIMLADQVNLQTRRSITLDAPQLVSNGNSTVSSAQVTLGNLNLNPQLQSLLDPILATSISPAKGSGTLNVSGQMVDLTGNFVVSGISQLNVVSSGGASSDDIRLNGVINSTNTALQGSLHTLGNVTLTADQVYPTTMSQFTLSVDPGNQNGTITIQPGQHGASPVMSAGGQLTLSAADIVQNGVLKAPLGTLNLNGGNTVTLGGGSQTSVSADGLIIPFGLIQGGNSWMYDLTGNGNLVPISALQLNQQKIVTLNGPKVTVAPGATVNLSGGGDLYANEFFAGTGGTVNVLDPAKAPANTFAIIPGISGFAPYDPQSVGQYLQGGSNTTLKAGASVYLAGGNGLAAGYYTLLPASYALLPGAYRVTAVSGYSDMQPGLGATTLLDGSQIMAGKFAVVGTNIQDARYSGFEVSPGAVVRTQSEYHDSYANAFFAAQAATSGSLAPRSPVDAGQLIVDATGALVLDGTFNSQPAAGGKGAWVDLNGPQFDIVNTAGTGIAGYVELTTSMLNNLGAESLLIGGVRTQTLTGTSIAVGADTVRVDNAGSVLAGPEIILAANNAVTVKAGSDIEGKGTFSGQASNITIANVNANGTSAYGDGALLRVSSAAQVTVARTNTAPVPLTATLSIEDGATVGAQNAVLLDSSNATTIGNKAVLKGQALSVAAQGIDVGTNPNPAATSLALTPTLLAQMQNFQDIALHSYTDINFYGAAALGGSVQGKYSISNLVLNAGNLNSIGNAGNTTIDASTVTLINNNGSSTASTPGGSGTLNINANQIILADGSKGIQGFDTVNLNAAQQITGQGTGSLTVSSGNAQKLALTGEITGTAKSNLSITASDYDVTIAAGTVSAPTTADVGAAFSLNGKSIADNGNIVMPSGAVTLHATNGVTLGAASQIVASGATKVIAGQTAYSPAGSVTLTSDNSNVDIASGAVVDVSGARNSNAKDGGDAGTFNVNATQGIVSIAGKLKGSAVPGHAQGSFVLDAKSLGTTLTTLDNQLMSGGFNQLIDIRVRSGDLALDAGSTVTAHSFHLAADNGKIDVSGKVDASGITGGDILLAALNNVTLKSGALLDAHASGTGQAGGKVTLETTAGVIDLNNQSIDVHGDGNTGGSVLLRAPQIAVGGSTTNNDVAINNNDLATAKPAASLNVSAGANVNVEAFKTYTATTIGAADVVAATSSVYYNDATNFANNNAAAIKTRLGMTASQHLTPGIEIDSTTNLALTADWDLSQWRFNNGNGTGAAFNTESGILTLKAAGDLIFGSAPTSALNATTNLVDITYHTASLSDGFAITPATATAPANYFTLLPVGSSSWSYRLVAGADATGANVLSVKNDKKGNVTLAEGGFVAGTQELKNKRGQVVVPYKPSTTYFEMIRTGTGSIDIAAGGDLYLGNSNSMIYTAGQQTILPASRAVTATQGPVFTTGGGDINIAVKGNISAVGAPDPITGLPSGSAVSQLITDWLWRQGSPNGTVAVQPAWWVDFGSFAQNIGALGGGNLNISAGGNITSLSAVVPSTGYVDTATGATKLVSGGNLSVKAGGNIDSGIFYVGNGQGTISAGGALDSSRKDANTTLYTILALGQGNIDVRTGGDLNLQTAFNPTMNGVGTMFFTYGDNSGISLESLNGNILLSNATTFYQGNVGTNLATTPYINPINIGTTAYPKYANPGALTVYPGTLNVTALNGSISTSSSPMRLFPSSTGNLQLIAGADINFNGLLTMSDVSPITLQPNTPVSNYIDTGSSDPMAGHGFVIDPVLGQVPVHNGDTTPIIIAAGGSIIGNNTVSPITPLLTLPKAANIQAGVDIVNLSMSVQNVQSTDTTGMTAGRDILFTPNPNSTSTSPINTMGITVTGPGQLVLQAGRNVDLGVSPGIVSNGNLANPYLPAQGAGITVLAGVGQGATDTQAFIDKYINPASAGTTYGADLIAYVDSYGMPQNQTAAQAFAYFDTLSQPLQDAFVRQVFFSELRSTGRSAVNTGNYHSGYAAIATLFPSGGYQGDINLYYSQIKTLRGGDINLLTPGGGVNAGLANPSSNGLAKTAAELGIVTVDGGNVNAFVNNDFTVNQSRVFTLQGGNILMWSSYGNIDAGKGSKSVSSTPPPLLVVDPKTGTFNVDVTQSVVGSGIRVLLANKNVVPGSVDLYAPAGVINAGDAGIGSAGNIYLGALQVLGANNINFGGVAAGVPIAAPAPVSVGLGNLQDASKAADQATQSLASVNSMNTNDFRPTFLSVEVIGLGDDANPRDQNSTQ